MEEHQESYLGRNIVIKPRLPVTIPEERAADEVAEPQLYIDDELVHTVLDSAGMYIAAGFAYDPQNSLTDLAQRIIDYRDATTQEREGHGHPEEPGEPDGG